MRNSKSSRFTNRVLKIESRYQLTLCCKLYRSFQRSYSSTSSQDRFPSHTALARRDVTPPPLPTVAQHTLALTAPLDHHHDIITICTSNRSPAGLRAEMRAASCHVALSVWSERAPPRPLAARERNSGTPWSRVRGQAARRRSADGPSYATCFRRLLRRFAGRGRLKLRVRAVCRALGGMWCWKGMWGGGCACGCGCGCCGAFGWFGWIGVIGAHTGLGEGIIAFVKCVRYA